MVSFSRGKRKFRLKWILVVPIKLNVIQARMEHCVKTDDESEEREFLNLEALQPIVDLINRNLTSAHHVLKAEAIDESHCSYGIWLTTNTTVSIFWCQDDDTWGAGIVDANGDWLD